MSKPHALVTNDDGIDSDFLHKLVAALLQDFRVTVAAPASEQSWIGRAMTRRGDIEVSQRPEVFDGVDQAWAIDGTPTDCVNIAMGNLLSEKPDIVLSGINIGYNTTETLILSSGTIAGAIEGALWGLPAVAFSKCVPNDLFEGIQKANGRTRGAFSQSLEAASQHATTLAKATLKEPPKSGCVININFPSQTTADSELLETFPAKIELGSLFTATSPGKYRFTYHDGITIQDEVGSDRAALDAGCISQSLLDFSRIGRPTPGSD
ncbi:MAG: 5'/3'-nucleotidase SurE [Verrucomicrobiota bacterium]